MPLLPGRSRVFGSSLSRGNVRRAFPWLWRGFTGVGAGGPTSAVLSHAEFRTMASAQTRKEAGGARRQVTVGKAGVRGCGPPGAGGGGLLLLPSGSSASQARLQPLKLIFGGGRWLMGMSNGGKRCAKPQAWVAAPKPTQDLGRSPGRAGPERAAGTPAWARREGVWGGRSGTVSLGTRGARPPGGGV